MIVLTDIRAFEHGRVLGVSETVQSDGTDLVRAPLWRVIFQISWQMVP